jgi:hypothetical protein
MNGQLVDVCGMLVARFIGINILCSAGIATFKIQKYIWFS